MENIELNITMNDVQRKKMINAIIYFSSNVQYPYKLKLFKLLFFLDFEHVKEKGKPVTSLEYYAWKMGPVPVKLFNEIKSGVPGDLSDSISIVPKQLDNDKEAYEFKPKVKANLDIFTPREKRIMDNLIFMYKDIKGEQMSEISHLKNKPWDKTIKDKGLMSRIDYILAIDSDSNLPVDDVLVTLSEREEIRENYIQANG